MAPRDTHTSESNARFLIVMRHAKSDWSDSGLSDHNRPLNDRGCRDAPRMADWLVEMDCVPDLILSSTSRRTRDTVDLMKAQWSSETEVSYCEALYLATPEGILRVIQSDGCDAKRLMVLAHNPGISHLVSMLAGQSIEMPTAAIAIFKLAIDDWGKLTSSGESELVHYMRPKAL